MAIVSRVIVLFSSTLLLGVSWAYGDTLKKAFDPKALESAIQESEIDSQLQKNKALIHRNNQICLLYTSPSPRDS